MTVPLRHVLTAKTLVIARLIALAFIIGAVYSAQSAPESSTVHACVNRYNGDVRIPRTEGQCASTEYPITWQSVDGTDLDDEYVNEEQEDSITSDMIVDGAVTSNDIEDGAIQSADLSGDLESDLSSLQGFDIEASELVDIEPNETDIVQSGCGVERVAIAGGGGTTGGDGILLESRPGQSTAANSVWWVKYGNDTSETISVRAYAVCVDP